MDLGDLTVVDDTWNSNPASVAASLEAIEELAAGRPIGLVLGAMLELGSETERAHRQLGALVQRLASRSTLESLVLVGQPFKGVLDTFPQLAVYVPSASEEFAVMAASHVAHSGHVVLVKGSRSFKLERVIEQLQTDSEEHRPRRTMSN
jgi:UDP-N-acetylmuramoyl-tripeptide--D-alanyl-D-alanine ligase